MNSQDIERLIQAIEKHTVVSQMRSIRNETIDGSQWNETYSRNIKDKFNDVLDKISNSFRESLAKNAEETAKHLNSYNEKLSSAIKNFDQAKSESDNLGKTLKKISDDMTKAGASQTEITKAQQRYEANVKQSLNDTSKKLADLNQNFEKKTQELNSQRNQTINNQIKQEQEIQKKMKFAIQQRQKALDKSAKEETFSQLTNGKSDRLQQRGYEYRRFGNAMRRYGKKEGGVIGSAMTKIGGMAKKIGGGIVKASPWLAALQQGCELAGAAMKMFAKNVEHQAKQQEFENKKEAVIHQRQLALTQSFGEEQQSEQQNIIAKAQNEIGMKSQLAVEGNAIVENAKAASVETGLKSLTDIAGGAFAAAAQQIDIGTSVKKYQNKVKTMLGENGRGDDENSILGAQNKLADTQLKLKKENIEAKNLSARTTANTSLAMIKQQQGQEKASYYTSTTSDIVNAVPIVNGMTQPLTEGGQAIMNAEFKLANARLEGVNQEKNYQAKLNETRTNIRTTMEGTAADFKKYGVETVVNMQNQIYDAQADAEAREEKAWLNFTQTIFNAFQKSETAAYQMGRAFGYNEEQLHTYAKNLSQTQVTVSKWGKNMEDMMKLQTSYQETTGRNTIFSEEDFNKSFANGLLMGDDIVSQLNAGMEPFNKSVADSNEMFYEMYRDVTKMGMSGKKYTKDLVNNLKLAEKYNFKGGVKSLMEMSKWAQNVRFNTGSLDGMLDKVQEGGLEEIIKQSAELQVLGGNFAMGSDPLAMAYEAYMDPEGYAKRMNGMIAGQGVMDSQTGEVSFGIASQQMIRQMAKTTGQDYKDVLAQAKQQVKVNKMKSVVNQNFNDDQIAAIANNAKYENGEWVVNTQNGVKNVSDLTSEDISSLSGTDDPTKSMDENIALMRSTQEKMKAAQEYISSTLQNGEWNTFKDDAEQMITNVTKHFNDDIPGYVNQIQGKMTEVVEAQKSMVNQIMGSNDADNTISAVRAAVQKLMTDTTGKIGETNAKLEDINNNLIAAFPDAHADTSEGGVLGNFRKKRNNASWIADLNTEGSDAFNTLKDLYENFDAYFSSMTDGERWLVSHWDPSGDKAESKVSDEHKKAVEELGNFDTMYKRLEIQHGKEYAEVFKQQWYGMHASGAGHSANRAFTEDGLISTNGNLSKINDGLVVQNGISTRIDKNDQVLAAKEGGPLDRMLDMVQPRPMPYDSYVKENPYYGGNSNNGSVGNNNGEIKIAPISITINGSISVNGSSIDLTTQIQNDPNFQNALWGLISQEVSKKVGNTGKMIDPLYNRIKNTF